ncbi:MAG: hypothetical protein AAB373_03740 [Patescibacteria group bacterium]
MESIKNFFNYFVSANPTQFNYDTLALILIGLLVAGAVAFSIIYKNKKKSNPVFKRMFKLTAGRMYLYAFLFLILLGLRYEGIPYFSMRLWTYLTLGFFVYFSANTVKTYYVDYKKEQASLNNRMESAKDKSTKRYVAAKK